MTDQDLMHARDPYLCRSLSKSHNFHLGFTSNTCLTTANTCKPQPGKLVTSLDHPKAAKRPRSGNQRKNAKRIDYDYKVGDKVLVINKDILRKAESTYGKEPWTITTVHTNGTIRIQRGTKMERLSIRRVEPFTDDIL